MDHPTSNGRPVGRGQGHVLTEYDPDAPTDYQPDEAINNPSITGLYMGHRRPRFHHDAPRWVTNLVFAFFLAIILASILLR
jgi:hypothetical protein